MDVKIGPQVLRHAVIRSGGAKSPLILWLLFLYVNIMRTVWTILLLGAFLSCSGRPERRLHPDEKRLAAAYAELFKLSLRVSPRGPAYRDSAEAALKKLHFSKNDFDRAVVSLNQEPERWEAFYLEVQALTSPDQKNSRPQTN
jgi:hypothetical protein